MPHLRDIFQIFYKSQFKYITILSLGFCSCGFNNEFIYKSGIIFLLDISYPYICFFYYS